MNDRLIYICHVCISVYYKPIFAKDGGLSRILHYLLCYACSGESEFCELCFQLHPCYIGLHVCPLLQCSIRILTVGLIENRQLDTFKYRQ